MVYFLKSSQGVLITYFTNKNWSVASIMVCLMAKVPYKESDKLFWLYEYLINHYQMVIFRREEQAGVCGGMGGEGLCSV